MEYNYWVEAYLSGRDKFKKGQAALGMIFLIGGVVVLVATTLAFLSFTFLNSTYGFQSSQVALSAASGGIEDAIIKLNRNKDFATSSYNLTIGSTTATISVSQNSPVSGQTTINSQATSGFYQKKLRAIVQVASSGEVFILSKNIITFP